MRIGKLSKPTYKYDRETAVEGSAAVVAEGAKKPKVSFKMTPVVANAAKIALYYKLSTETVQDAPAFTYSLQGRGIELVLQEEDDQLLYGTGVGEEALGLFTAATAFNAGSLRVENAQVIDVLYAAITQVRKSMFRANAIFMNPTDIAKMNLTKDADGRYLLPNILSNSASTIAGVTIAGIDAVNEGEFLVGALDLAVETFSVEDLHVEVSGSNEDDFITNKVTVLIEERLLQAITRPAALVKGSFATATAALMAA
ncbi:capsid protein [Hymenobacter sp. APR13]|nr:capsid protein [Hymenobacter sp. APR13]